MMDKDQQLIWEASLATNPTMDPAFSALGADNLDLKNQSLLLHVGKLVMSGELGETVLQQVNARDDIQNLKKGV